jgi:NADPH-dependent 7-cyano-7-deazaguanine reductase QueF
METKTKALIGDSYIEFSSPELIWLGESGQPYRGTLYIQYTANQSAIDLISLKKYITSLRSRIILLEDIAETIYNELAINDTFSITVKTTARGGISSTIHFGDFYESPQAKPLYFGIGA